MLLVKTAVKPSRIHGRGLFANQNIRKGQAVWIYDSSIDKKFPKKKLAKLPARMQKFVKYWSYLNDRDEYVLCGDGARYINHSDRPNTLDVKTFLDMVLGREGVTIASKEIKRGEEITSKYLYFTLKGKAKHL
jgi:SET domain-containing protein